MYNTPLQDLNDLLQNRIFYNVRTPVIESIRLVLSPEPYGRPVGDIFVYIHDQTRRLVETESVDSTRWALSRELQRFL